ncbi:MAG: ABC transporter permease [Flavobacteriales bacterium]|jgi:lipoprotein-releasing system permease protein
MKIASFIANRILRSDDKTRISRPIVRIATIGIAVGICMMLLSIAIVSGFQQEIRNKVIGFGSHFQVISNEQTYSRDSQRLRFNEELYKRLQSVPGVRHVQVYATKPGIMESEESIQGVIVKGVGQDYDWTFLKGALIEGECFTPGDSVQGIVLSKYIASRMKLRVGEKAKLLFFDRNDDVRQRNFVVRGIYDTGLEDFDKQFVFVDLAAVQRLYGWGMRVSVAVDTTEQSGVYSVYALASGGEGEHEFVWSDSTWQGPGPHLLQSAKDTLVQLEVRDEADTEPCRAHIFLEQSAADSSSLITRVKTTASDSIYVGGYEVLIHDFEQLWDAQDLIQSAVTAQFLQVQKITERNADIFTWLEMLDINVIVIIALMIFVSVVNMTSALLIIILERQQMIGTLKSMGIADSAVMRIFIRNAAWIIGKGMLWGNLAGIGLAYIQHRWSIVKLDAENYYLDRVPIKFDLTLMLAMDAGTLVICILAMIVPAMYVLRISPIKAIRFS